MSHAIQSHSTTSYNQRINKLHTVIQKTACSLTQVSVGNTATHQHQ